MIKEHDNFIIEYDKDILYIGELIKKLEDKSKDIRFFFKLGAPKEKVKIKVWKNRDEFKKYLEENNYHYYDFSVGITANNNIHILSFDEARKQRTHANMSLEDYLEILLHEYVHSCQNEINNDNVHTKWFSEGLATNLGNPSSQVLSDIIYEEEELTTEEYKLNNFYKVSYTIVRYMIENMASEEIIDYIKDKDKLIRDTSKILDKASIWFKEKYLKLPVTPKCKNDDFIIYADDELKEFSIEVLEYLTRNKKRLLKFFNLGSYRKVEVNLFTSKENFLSYLKTIRNHNNRVPEYASMTFDDDKLNILIQKEEVEKRKYPILNHIVHEFIHLLYNSMSPQRIIWLDEGLAENLSHEHNDYENNFDRFFKEKILNLNIIPNINELVHGKCFVNEEYNGYDLSFFVVYYLLETIEKEAILSYVNNPILTYKLGDKIVEDAIKYYKKKIQITE